MDSTTIFSKTAKGMKEANGTTSVLPRTVRSVLKEIDGKKTYADLVQLFSKYPEADLQEMFEDLVREGYLRNILLHQSRAATEPPVTPPAPVAGANEEAIEDLDFTAIASASPAAVPPAPRGEELKARQEAEARAKREAEERARKERTADVARQDHAVVRLAKVVDRHPEREREGDRENREDPRRQKLPDHRIREGHGKRHHQLDGSLLPFLRPQTHRDRGDQEKEQPWQKLEEGNKVRLIPFKETAHVECEDAGQEQEDDDEHVGERRDEVAGQLALENHERLAHC